MKDVIFWGATGQAKVMRECLSGRPYKIVALFDNDKTLQTPFPGVPLFFGKSGYAAWAKKRGASRSVGFLVTIGGHCGADRLEIQTFLESQGHEALVARHNTAFIAEDALLGAGTQVCGNASVGALARVGRGCLINTGAIIDHECEVGDGVHVMPGAHVAGLVRLRRFASIGTGATILPRLTIGEGAFVGAGAVVTRDVKPGSVVAGNPARPLRHKSKREGR